MSENGKIIKCTEMDFFLGLMEELIKGLSCKIKNKDLEFLLGRTKGSIKAGERTENKMEKVFLSPRKAVNRKESGKKEDGLSGLINKLNLELDCYYLENLVGSGAELAFVWRKTGGFLRVKLEEILESLCELTLVKKSHLILYFSVARNYEKISAVFLINSSFFWQLWKFDYLSIGFFGGPKFYLIFSL